MAVHMIYRFYAELDNYSPKMWRRFEINGSKTMAELGYTLMTMFEMQASHLFCFIYDHSSELLEDMRTRYSKEELKKMFNDPEMLEILKPWRYELPLGDIYEDEDEKWCDASQYHLKNISSSLPWEFTFEYDYGDSWIVNLRLESCEKVEIHAGELPRVLEGDGFGIIEDCGGVSGLEDIAKAFKKKKGRTYNEYRKWLGSDDLDLSEFDIDDMNFRLKKIPRIYKEVYEMGYEPTQRSIDLIERKYKKTDSI